MTQPSAAIGSELLGALAYSELTLFDRLADDARISPRLADRVQLTAFAVNAFGHHQDLSRGLSGTGQDPELAMAPFQRPFDAFHLQTRPKTWYEGLLKSYLGDGLATDLYRDLAGLVDSGSQAVITPVLDDTDLSEFTQDRVAAVVRDDPGQAGRLALWGRRLLGDAMAQARVVTGQSALARALAEESVQDQRWEISQLFARLVAGHADRMKLLGLNA